MGYFKAKLRRSVAGAKARRFAAAATADWDHAATAAEEPPIVGYVRLAVNDGERGVFSAAYQLRDLSAVTEADRAELVLHLSWFERQLKPHAPGEAAAVFWFRADAADHVGRIWGLVRLLQRYGRDVRMWTTRRPGRIVFRDAFQVAAVPYRDGRVTAKQLPAVRYG